jgi:O-antigen/teichoic acid export membrane protein
VISKAFLKSSIVYTLAGSLPMASGIILLPFYIYYLSTDTFGAFTILIAFSLLIQIVVSFSFDTSVYIHFHEYKNSPREQSRFISSSFIFIVAIGLGVAILLLLIGDFVLANFFKGKNITFYPYGLAAVGIGIFQSFLKVYNSLLQTRQQPELFFRSNLFAFSIIAVLTIIGLKMYPNSLVGPMGARLVSAMACGTWCFYRIVREYGWHYDHQLVRATFSFNFYSFLYQLQQWTLTYFDRILLSFFLPLSQVGVYGAFMSCLAAIEFILNGLHSSFSPKVVALVIDKKEKIATPEVNRYYYGLTAVAMVVVAGTILVLPWAIEMFITKKDYRMAIPFIPFASLIYLFRSMRLYAGIPYGILKYNKPLPLIYLGVVAVKISLLILFVKDYGLYAAIGASLIAYLAEIVLLYLIGKSKYQYGFNSFKLLLAPISLMALILILEPLLAKNFPTVVHGSYVVASLLLLVWAFRNEMNLFKSIGIFASK